MEQLRIGFKPWEEVQVQSLSQDTDATNICPKRFVKNLDRKKVLSTWGMLYCGGAKVVEQDLKQISEEYQLDLHIESFGW